MKSKPVKLNTILKPAGVTLVETLVYMALLAFIFVTIGGFATFMIKSNTEANEKIDIQKNIIYLNEHLSDTFKVSTAINATNSIFDTTPGKLQVTGAGQTLTYDTQSNRIRVNRNGTINYLISPSYTTERFIVQKVLDSHTNLVGARVDIIISVESNPTVKGSLSTMFLLKS